MCSFFIALVRVCCKLAKAFLSYSATCPELLSVQLSKEPLVISKYQQVSASITIQCKQALSSFPKFAAAESCFPLQPGRYSFFCSPFLNCSLTACLEAAQLQMTDKTVKQSGIFLSQKLPKERVKIPKTVQKHRKCRKMLYI